jgi:LysM repeat protein
VAVYWAVGASALTATGRAALAGGGPSKPTAARVYVVRPGDTLWGIATRLGDPRADPRATVDRLVAANGIRSGVIWPGERLVVLP